MKQFLRLENPIMTYAWGSHRAIADLLGGPTPSVEPQAELWMGAHPKAPSFVQYRGRRQSLRKLIQRFPREILGPAVAERFNCQLPFLFKVLAAEQPLSIQVHPNQVQAREGFERENDLGIPPHAAERNYKDANHKPECLCALTRFWALCGFRPISEIVDGLGEICPAGLAAELAVLGRQADGRALSSFLANLLRLNRHRRKSLLAEARAGAQKLAGAGRAEGRWVLGISETFPEDVGLLAPLLLNLIQLEPGQALFLPAGCLHTYLDGTAIEIMANSDNVLRGGLTHKHVDVDELLRTVRFDEAGYPDVITPIAKGPSEKHYPAPAVEFELSVVSPTSDRPYASPRLRNVEILLCTEGLATIAPDGRPQAAQPLGKGSCLLVPAAAPAYVIAGEAVVYRASVPAEGAEAVGVD